MSYKGDFVAGATVYIKFSTSDGDGGAVAPSSAFEAADIKIYKNASDTERTGISGVTVVSPFDSIVGLHDLSIDLSDDDDTGFYVQGDYSVVLDPDETVDGQTVVREIATFSIENRDIKANVVEWKGGTVLTPAVTGVPRVDALYNSGVLMTSSGGRQEVNNTHWAGSPVAVPTVAGVPEVDPTYWKGGLIPSQSVAGVPEVDMTHIAGNDNAARFLPEMLAADTFNARDTFARLQIKSGSFVAGRSIDLYGTTALWEDDWGDTIGSLANNGVWTDDAGLGTTETADERYILVDCLGVDPQDTDLVIALETSPDGITYVEAIRFNLKGVTGNQFFYIQSNGTLRYHRAGSINMDVRGSDTLGSPVWGGVGDDGLELMSKDVQTGIQLQPAVGDDFIARQADVSNITATGSAINKPVIADNASSPILGVSSVGTPTNTFSAAVALDGVLHSIAHVGNAIDWIYGFNVGTTGVPTGITVTGYVNGINDEMIVEGRDYGSNTWVQIGTWDGQATTTILPHPFAMFTTMVDINGDVNIRLRNTGQSALFAMNVDQIFVSHSVVTAATGYEGGAVWVDTINGVAGTVDDVNGVAERPSLSLADAITIAASKGFTKFQIVQGSSITLSQTFNNYLFDGHGWTLDLNGQDIAGTHFFGAATTGTGTGANPGFHDCEINSISIGTHHFEACSIAGDITVTAAGDIIWDQCYSGVAGLGTPSIDVGGAVGDTSFSNRHYSGGLELKNMGASGTDNVSLEGVGQYILNANCTGGTLAVRGSFKKTDNSGGAVMINDDANAYSPVLRTGKIQAATLNTVTLDANASVVDGRYDPSIIEIVGGDTRAILEYDGTTKIAILDRNFKTIPTGDVDDFKIIADAGREHVNEGLAMGGTSNTIQLNALASSEDGAYIDQVVFIRSGLNGVDDQRRVVIAYDGGTQTATVDRDWDVIPITANKPAYSMLPYVGTGTTEFRAAVNAMTSKDASVPSWFTGNYLPGTDALERIGENTESITATTVVITPLTAATNSVLQSGQQVEVVIGNKGALFNVVLSGDWTAFSFTFSAKDQPGDSAFAIGPNDVAGSDVTLGTDADGNTITTIDIRFADGDLDIAEGVYVAELTADDGDSSGATLITPIQFPLKVIEGLIG